MSVKELWISLYDEALGEYLDAGMDPKEAEDLATRYAERNLPDLLADYGDYTRERQREGL